MKRLSFLLLFLLLGADGSAAWAQKRSDRSGAAATDRPSSTVGPKRTDRTIPESEKVKAIKNVEFVRVAVRANKGYLSVVAAPGARVTLTPAAKKTPLIAETIKDEDGSLNLINLPPGKYALRIEHEDYLPYNGPIQVEPARLDTFVALNKMTARFGAIRIGGAPEQAAIALDGAPANAADLTSDSGGLLLRHVAIGKHRLQISQPGYVPFDKQVEVPPGMEKPLVVAAPLELARVTVTLQALAGARVYVGSEEKAIVPADGAVALSLLPGTQSIRVVKDGFLEWKKELTLSLAPVTEKVALVPIPASAEGDWQPSLGARKWFPASPGWKFSNAGALVRGDAPVFFDTESNRDFNIYRDFRLEFDLVFSNGKGAAWIARARDAGSYYLFEISGPRSGKPVFNFYLCRNGQLEWKDSRPIVEKIDKPGESLHILFEARGDRFEARMTIASAPSATPHLIGIFQDDAYSYGGVGFRGKDQSEALLQSFFVLPVKEKE